MSEGWRTVEIPDEDRIYTINPDDVMVERNGIWYHVYVWDGEKWVKNEEIPE